MRLEYDTLVRMGCWDIIDIPSVKVYIQQQDVHNPQSFSPTISQVSLCIVMVLTSMKGFRSWDLDATSVFVSAPLSEGETGYMDHIPGFTLPKGKRLKLKRTLYGLVQAPLDFYKLFREVYISVIDSLRQRSVSLSDMKIMSKLDQ